MVIRNTSTTKANDKRAVALATINALRKQRIDITQATDIVIAACIETTATAIYGAAMRVLLLERGYRYIDEVTKSDWRVLMRDLPVVVGHISLAQRDEAIRFALVNTAKR